jgi:NAD(P)-dependent dehydrogenase (short-subunit alcohol dehydrogenase family)
MTGQPQPPVKPGIVAVTGASRGIGRATAIELARRGYRVFALARSEPELRRLASEGAGNGWDIVPLVMDIGDESSTVAAAETVLGATANYGLDVLVNNAGYGQMGPLEEIPPRDLRRQLEVNVVGQLAFTQPFLPGMRSRRRGTIVNISSVAGRMSAPFSGAYAASKFALEALSDALRSELAPFGIHVILVEPGPIRTAFSETARATSPAGAGSPYAGFIRRFEENRKGWYVFEQGPESVARVIAGAVESDRPRARYTVTLPARATNLVRRLVPDSLSDWALQRSLGHDD